MILRLKCEINSTLPTLKKSEHLNLWICICLLHISIGLFLRGVGGTHYEHFLNRNFIYLCSVMACGEPPVPSPSPAPAQPAHQPDEGHLEADWVWLEEQKRLVLSLTDSLSPHAGGAGPPREKFGLCFLDFFLCYGIDLGRVHLHTFTPTHRQLLDFHASTSLHY